MPENEHQTGPVETPDLKATTSSSIELESSAPPATNEPAGNRLYTGRGRSWSPARALLGLAALAALIQLALTFSEVEEMRTPARVGASKVFRITDNGSARYQWSLYDGTNAGSLALQQQQLLRFEQSETVKIEFAEGLIHGAMVNAGDPLLHFRSPTNLRRLEVLKAEQSIVQSEQAEILAQRAEITAELELLEAGERPETIAEAKRKLEVAQAELRRSRNALAESKALYQQGALAQSKYDDLRYLDDVYAKQVSVEQAKLARESAPARSQDQAALQAKLSATIAQEDASNARLKAIETRIAERELLLAEQTVVSPISGQVSLGGEFLVEVISSKSVVLHLPIPIADRYHIETGQPVEFVSQMTGESLHDGTILNIASQSTLMGTEPVFWATASLPIGSGLDVGMMGTARLELQGDNEGILTSLKRQIIGN